jgi:hypothetical protein
LRGAHGGAGACLSSAITGSRWTMNTSGTPASICRQSGFASGSSYCEWGVTPCWAWRMPSRCCSGAICHRRRCRSLSTMECTISTRGPGVLARLGGSFPLYQIHAYTRHLSEFTEPGWEACYRRIARIMGDEPEVRGLYGGTWFFDPELQRVSPRLTYVRRLPIDDGAGSPEYRAPLTRTPTRCRSRPRDGSCKPPENTSRGSTSWCGRGGTSCGGPEPARSTFAGPCAPRLRRPPREVGAPSEMHIASNSDTTMAP